MDVEVVILLVLRDAEMLGLVPVLPLEIMPELFVIVDPERRDRSPTVDTALDDDEEDDDAPNPRELPPPPSPSSTLNSAPSREFNLGTGFLFNLIGALTTDSGVGP